MEHTASCTHKTKWAHSDLQVITGFLAIGDSLDLSGRCEVQGLALVWETEGSGYPHVCQRKVVHIQQWPQAGQTENRWFTGLGRKKQREKKYSVSLIVRSFKLPEGHNVAIGTETGEADPCGHRHHISSKYEGGLGDVVLVDAVLGGQCHHLSLLLWADHSVLTVLVLLRRRRGCGPASPWPFFLLLRGVGLIPGLINVGQKRPAGIQLGHAQNASFQAHHWTCDGRKCQTNKRIFFHQ